MWASRRENQDERVKAGRFYIFSPDRLRFEEARWARLRIVAVTIVLALVLVVAGLELNQQTGDALGLGFGRSEFLLSENALLKDQLRLLSRRLSSLEGQLVSLHDRGNELRLLVDLPKIDEDTRKAGTGGAPMNLDFGFSGSVNDLLGELHGLLERTDRELQLQTRSYREVQTTYEQNKVRFAHLPAIKPMAGYYAVNSFGMRLHPVLRIMKSHEGLDIANDVGTPVYATADGTVDYAGRTGGGYGIALELDHGYGYTTFYAHLSKLLVREGQRVKRGDMIARSGKTGLVSGPHLHYEVRHKGIRLNPVDFFFDDITIGDYREQLASMD